MKKYKKAKKSKKQIRNKIPRNKSVVSPLTYVVSLTQKEVDSFNSFTEERLMVLKCFKPKIHLRDEQWLEVQAVIFNGLVAAFCAGIQLKSRVYKLNFATSPVVKIIKRRA